MGWPESIPSREVIMVLVAGASTILVGAIAFAHYYIYRAYGTKYFRWVAIAWLLNLIYIIAESAISIMNIAGAYSLVLVSLIAFPSTLVFYVALTQLRKHSQKSTKLSSVIVVLGSVICLIGWAMGCSYVGVNEKLAFFFTVFPQVFLTLYVLILLAHELKSLSEISLLRLMRTRDTKSLSPTSLNEVDKGFALEFDPSTMTARVLRNVRRARLLYYLSFSMYGYLQVVYLSYPYAADSYWFKLTFVIALTVKAMNGLAVPYLLLANLQQISEALKLHSLQVELGAMTLGIEHDIRSPMGILRNTTKSMRERFQGQGEIMGYLTKLTKNLDRIQAAADVIPAIRESEDYYRQRFATWSLVDLVRKALKGSQKYYDSSKSGIRIEFATSQTSGINIQGYGERLEQAFINIINNAIEASFEKDPKSPPTIIIECKSDRERMKALVTVLDYGSGISEEDLPQVTKAMFSTKSSENANRGIGLFIVKRIIEQHQGQIIIESKKSEFTKVTVELPIS